MAKNDQWEEVLNRVTQLTDETVSAIEEKIKVLDEWFEYMQTFKQKVEKAVTDLTLKKSHLIAENEELKEKYNSLSDVVKEKENQLTILTESLDSQVNNLALLKKEYDTQVELCENAKRKSELSDEDRRLLTEAKLKLDLYQEVTGIKWDFSVPDSEAARGFVRDRNTGRLSAFDLRRNRYSQSELCETLWSIIENGTGKVRTPLQANTSDQS